MAASAASGRSPCASPSASPARSSSHPARSGRLPRRHPRFADASAFASPPQPLALSALAAASASVHLRDRPLLFALCSLLFFRLGRLFYVDRRHQRAVFQEVGRRGQRSRVRIHFDSAQIGGAGAVGVDRGNRELKNDVVFDPLRDDFAHRTRQIDDGRKRRTFLSARDVCDTDRVRRAESRRFTGCSGRDLRSSRSRRASGRRRPRQS